MNGFVVPAHACLEAWINCESLLSELSTREVSYAHKLEKTVDECAHICMETWQALKNHPQQARHMVLQCIDMCEECMDACDRYDDEWFGQCARACRNCANKLTDLSQKHSLQQ